MRSGNRQLSVRTQYGSQSESSYSVPSSGDLHWFQEAPFSAYPGGAPNM